MMANANSWVNSRIFEGYLSLLYRKMGIKIEKFCCALRVYNSLKEHNIFQEYKEPTVPPSYSF
jgi:hypothetical protein